MTITLHLKPEIEAGLLARAQASGMALEEYLLSLVEEAAISASADNGKEMLSSRKSAVQRMLAFGEKYHLSLGEPVTRTLLHDGHRF